MWIDDKWILERRYQEEAGKNNQRSSGHGRKGVMNVTNDGEGWND